MSSCRHQWEVRDRWPRFISLRCQKCGHITTLEGDTDVVSGLVNDAGGNVPGLSA